MGRQSFVTTPFIDLDPLALSVSSYTGAGGDPSVMFQLGRGLTMHVYDPALLVRLAEVVAQGRDLLDAALSGQDPLPVRRDDDAQADAQLVEPQTLGVA